MMNKTSVVNLLTTVFLGIKLYIGMKLRNGVSNAAPLNTTATTAIIEIK